MRDGRSMATREVALAQGDRSLLTMIASFHAGDAELDLSEPEPLAPGPDGIPTLQDWVPAAVEAGLPNASIWVDRPPPVELRIAEPTTFLGGRQASGPRSHWMRLAGRVEGPAAHRPRPPGVRPGVPAPAEYSP